MKILLFLSIILNLLYSKSEILSSIPPVENEFINLSVKECKRECLKELISQDKIMSFLSLYKNHSQYDDIQSLYDKYANIFKIKKQNNIEIKIAMLIPQNSIRRYAISTVNSVLSYMIYRKFNFDLKVYYSSNENKDAILNAIYKIKQDNYRYIIAPVTQKGAETIVNNSDGFTIYIPTVHKIKIGTKNPNILFGGINYKEQIDKLLTYTNNKIAIFSDSSSIANELNNHILNSDKKIVYEKKFQKSRQNFKKLLKWNKKLDNSSVFLNLPLVKTSLLLSQFRVYKRKPYRFLSTQINYNPMILTLTQYADRKNLLIANSIQKANEQISITNDLLGSDIRYDWVNYSTTLGIDIMFHRFFTPTQPKSFNENIKEGQILYNTSIIAPKRYTMQTISQESLE